MGLTKILVRALIAGLCVAAAGAVVALLAGDFGETYWRIIGTSLGFSLFTAFGAAGESLRERVQDRRRFVGAATTALALIAFLLLVFALWVADDSDGPWRAWGVVALLALFGSHVSVVLRAQRDDDSPLIRKLVWASIATAAVATVVGDLAIAGWIDDIDDGYVRGLGVVLVVAVLTTALPPVLRRLDAQTSLRTAHTADLDAATLNAARALLHDVFEGELTDSDWEHALGGIHALAYENGELVGHAAVIQRRLIVGRTALRAGYVEAVGVRADARRRGHATKLMEALERVIRHAYDVGALGATDEGAALYASRGWRRWEGPLFALTPDGRVRTQDEDGAVFVLADTLDLSGELTCDWRDGDVW